MAQVAPVKKRIVPTRVAANEVATGNLSELSVATAASVGGQGITTDVPIAPGRRISVDISTAYLVNYVDVSAFPRLLPRACAPLSQHTPPTPARANRMLPIYLFLRSALDPALQLLRAAGVDPKTLKDEDAAKDKDTGKEGKPPGLPRMPGAPWDVSQTTTPWLFSSVRSRPWQAHELQ